MTYTPSQMAIAKFSIAVDRPPKNGEKETDFFRVTAFGRTAENCGKFLAKGKKVGVDGRVQISKYKNKAGQEVTSVEVIADNVEFLEWADTPKRNPDYAGERFKPRKEAFEDLPEDGFAQIEADLPF